MFIARILMYFELCHNVLIEVKVNGEKKSIFFVQRHSSRNPDFTHQVFVFSNHENAEYCLFEFDEYAPPILEESTDGAEFKFLFEQLEDVVLSDMLPSGWVDVCDSPFLEKCFALSLFKTETLFQGS